jgi:hypothetical protein
VDWRIGGSDMAKCPHPTLGPPSVEVADRGFERERLEWRRCLGCRALLWTRATVVREEEAKVA